MRPAGGRTDVGRPGALLLHPAHVVALVVLGLNDHLAKEVWPGMATGKLSDVAGLVVAPVVVVSALELLLRRSLRPAAVVAVAAVCAAGLALVQVAPTATRAYAVGLGWLQWAAAGAVGAPWTVAVTADPTDLWTLPAAAVPVVLALRSGRLRARPTAQEGPPRTSAPTSAAPRTR